MQASKQLRLNCCANRLPRTCVLQACEQSTLTTNPRRRNVSGEACARAGERGTAGIICDTILAPSPQSKRSPRTPGSSVSARPWAESYMPLQVPLPMLTIEQLHKGITTSAEGQAVSVYGVCSAVRAVSSQIYSRTFRCGGCEAVQQTFHQQLPHSCCPESAASPAVLEEDLSCRVQEEVSALNGRQGNCRRCNCHIVATVLPPFDCIIYSRLLLQRPHAACHVDKQRDQEHQWLPQVQQIWIQFVPGSARGALCYGARRPAAIMVTMPEPDLRKGITLGSLLTVFGSLAYALPALPAHVHSSSAKCMLTPQVGAPSAPPSLWHVSKAPNLPSQSFVSWTSCSKERSVCLPRFHPDM